MSTYYVLSWIILFYISYVYLRVSRVPLLASTAENSNSSHSVLRRIKYYPFVLAFTIIFATIRRTYELFQNEQLFFLMILQVATQGLQGFFNALIYGLTPKVIEVDSKCFKKYCCCCCRERRNSLTVNASGEGLLLHCDEAYIPIDPEQNNSYASQFIPNDRQGDVS